MKQLWGFLIVGVLLAEWAGITIAADPAQNAAPVEVKVKPDELPKAVSDALKARFPALEITSAVKETENGNVVFDIELTQKSRKFESDIKEDGTILEIEKEVDPKNYPKALAASVDAKYPKAKITIVMEVNLVKGKKETPDHLEVSVQYAVIPAAITGTTILQSSLSTKLARFAFRACTMLRRYSRPFDVMEIPSIGGNSPAIPIA